MLKQFMMSLATTVSMAVAFSVHGADLKIGFIDQERITRESAPAERASCLQVEQRA
jgi:Skp family chaperone for outer membrane proteins